MRKRPKKQNGYSEPKPESTYTCWKPELRLKRSWNDV